MFENNLIFADPEHKEKLDEVIKAFDVYFKPSSGMIHAWYQMESLYSQNCKGQSDFMSKLCELSNACEFTNPEEVIKFIFLTYNKGINFDIAPSSTFCTYLVVLYNLTPSRELNQPWYESSP